MINNIPHDQIRKGIDDLAEQKKGRNCAGRQSYLVRIEVGDLSN